MKVIIGYVCSKDSDEEMPIYEEMSEEDYRAGCDNMKSELYSLVRDYVFDKLKEKEGLSL